MTTPDPLGGVQIGAREIYDEVRSQSARLAAMDASLQLLVQRADHGDQRVADHESKIQRLDERMDAVEARAVTRSDLNSRSQRVIAAVAVIVTAAGIVVSAVVAISTNGG